MTPKLALFLREYRAERERLYHELGKQLSLDDLVFAGPEGKPIDPCVLTHAFTRLARQTGLEGFDSTTLGIPSPVSLSFVVRSRRSSLKPSDMPR